MRLSPLLLASLLLTACSSAPSEPNVTNTTVRTFLSGKTYVIKGGAGEEGILNADGTFTSQYTRSHPQTALPRWTLTDDALSLRFSEQTTLTYPLAGMRFFLKDGTQILAAEGCLHLIGDSSALLETIGIADPACAGE